MNKILFPSLLFITLLAACDASDKTGVPQGTSTMTVANKAIPVRNRDFTLIAQGGKLYQQNCAGCHGNQAEGTADWRKRNSEDKYPPPPLNGTAHTWHHPTRILKDIIKNGTIRIGGSMPPWGDKLTDQEIAAIVAWFQDKWSDQIYANWVEIENRKRK